MPSWLVHKHRANVNLLPLDDLVWLYTSVTTKKIYGFIPYSWKHALHVADRNGKVYDIKASKKAVPEAAAVVLQRVPWVLAGHSDDIQKAFRTNRKLVIDTVDERRQQVLQQWAQQQQPPPSA